MGDTVTLRITARYHDSKFVVKRGASLRHLSTLDLRHFTKYMFKCLNAVSQSSVSISYKDDEGDEVPISSDSELNVLVYMAELAARRGENMEINLRLPQPLTPRYPSVTCPASNKERILTIQPARNEPQTALPQQEDPLQRRVRDWVASSGQPPAVRPSWDPLPSRPAASAALRTPAATSTRPAARPAPQTTTKVNVTDLFSSRRPEASSEQTRDKEQRPSVSDPELAVRSAIRRKEALLLGRSSSDRRSHTEPSWFSSYMKQFRKSVVSDVAAAVKAELQALPKPEMTCSCVCSGATNTTTSTAEPEPDPTDPADLVVTELTTRLRSGPAEDTPPAYTAAVSAGTQTSPASQQDPVPDTTVPDTQSETREPGTAFSDKVPDTQSETRESEATVSDTQMASRESCATVSDTQSETRGSGAAFSDKIPDTRSVSGESGTSAQTPGSPLPPVDRFGLFSISDSTGKSVDGVYQGKTVYMERQTQPPPVSNTPTPPARPRAQEEGGQEGEGQPRRPSLQSCLSLPAADASISLPDQGAAALTPLRQRFRRCHTVCGASASEQDVQCLLVMTEHAQTDSQTPQVIPDGPTSSAVSDGPASDLDDCSEVVEKTLAFLRAARATPSQPTLEEETEVKRPSSPAKDGGAAGDVRLLLGDAEDDVEDDDYVTVNGQRLSLSEDDLSDIVVIPSPSDTEYFELVTDSQIEQAKDDAGQRSPLVSSAMLSSALEEIRSERASSNEGDETMLASAVSAPMSAETPIQDDASLLSDAADVPDAAGVKPTPTVEGAVADGGGQPDRLDSTDSTDSSDSTEEEEDCEGRDRCMSAPASSRVTITCPAQPPPDVTVSLPEWAGRPPPPPPRTPRLDSIPSSGATVDSQSVSSDPPETSPQPELFSVMDPLMVLPPQLRDSITEQLNGLCERLQMELATAFTGRRAAEHYWPLLGEMAAASSSSRMETLLREQADRPASLGVLLDSLTRLLQMAPPDTPSHRSLQSALAQLRAALRPEDLQELQEDQRLEELSPLTAVLLQDSDTGQQMLVAAADVAAAGQPEPQPEPQLEPRPEPQPAGGRSPLASLLPDWVTRLLPQWTWALFNPDSPPTETEAQVIVRLVDMGFADLDRMRHHYRRYGDDLSEIVAALVAEQH